jgi:hypothetical protein
MAKKQTTEHLSPLLRVISRTVPLAELLANAAGDGLPVMFSTAAGSGESEESSAIDPSLTTVAGNAPPPQPGTSYAGLTPTQRHAFLAWSVRPELTAPLAFQQLYLANLEARLFENDFRQRALDKLAELGAEPAWSRNVALHRAILLACWIQQDGNRLAEWIAMRPLPAELLGIALGQQAMIGHALTPQELGTTLTTWQLGGRLANELLTLRLDSLTAILGHPPLAYALTQLDDSATQPRPWRSTHRGLHLLIPQPDVRHILEPSLRDLLAVADVDEQTPAPIGNLASLDTTLPDEVAEQAEQPSMEELGWRLILEFGSNRSEYFDYVLIQAQKLAGYSQIMDEDRRMIYRIIFRKSEMRRFWRIWDYVHGWTSTRVYVNGVELEKWKVWPQSHYLY